MRVNAFMAVDGKRERQRRCGHYNARADGKIWAARLLRMYVVAQIAFHKRRTITDELPSLPTACRSR